MKIPNPDGRKCVYCGKPVNPYGRYAAAKTKKGGIWNYAHSECAYKYKRKEAAHEGKDQG